MPRLLLHLVNRAWAARSEIPGGPLGSLAFEQSRREQDDAATAATIKPRSERPGEHQLGTQRVNVARAGCAYERGRQERQPGLAKHRQEVS